MAAVVLMTLPHERQLILATTLRSTVLAPVLRLQSGLADMGTMRARVEHLRVERDSFSVKLLALQNVAEENLRLRMLLELAERGTSTFVPANLYLAGRAGEGVKRAFVLDIGRNASVQADAPVVAPGGLVGVVRAVGRGQSTGDFWTHPQFRVSAMTVDGRVFGIIKSLGDSPPLMELDGAPYQVELTPGTELVTSGQGGVFPRGIPIGRVAELMSAEAGWARSYRVRPAVYPDAVREVMVLIGGGETSDVTELWTSEGQR
jgi:rod shape-determining protein MreC